METYSLINGFEIPKVAYGSAIVDTYRYYSDSKKTKIKYFVKNRIKNSKQFKKDMGLRNILKREHGTILIDTSRAYAGSEAIIGKYANDKTIICTKICNSDQIAGTIKKGVNKSLKELRREQIDILLMHWPVTGKYIDTWKYIEELYNNRKVKAIGVCNCNIHHLEEIKDKCDILPMINQFECHPLFNQEELREYCRLNNIQVMAYTATARMDERWKCFRNMYG